MKRTTVLLGPPLAFLLASVMGWLTGPSVIKIVSPDRVDFRSPRQREFEVASAGDPTAMAARFENEMLGYRAQPIEIHDMKGMEIALEMDHRNEGLWCGGMDGTSYAIKWAGESPTEMFQWLIHEGGSDLKMRVSKASILFEAWAEKDREAALAAVFEIPDANIRRQALASSLEVLYKSDPTRAREMMMKHLDLFPPELEGSLFKPYDSGKTTFDFLLSLPAGVERTHLLADLLKSMARWGGEVTGEAIAIWRKAPEAMRREWFAAGFSSDNEHAVSFDGLETMAREQVEMSGNPRFADDFMAVHGAAWAKRDLAGALDWARVHLKGKSRAERSAGLFETAANQDLDTALKVWQTLPEGSLKDRAAEAISKGTPADRKSEAEAVVKSLIKTTD